jgi:hypothetical protein
MIMIRIALLLLLCLPSIAPAMEPAEQDFRIGASLLHNNTGLAAQMMLLQPVSPAYSIQFGGGIWSPTSNTKLNWDWSGGVRSCWAFGLCFFIGADYLQRIDYMNGAHTNWLWSFSYQFGNDDNKMLKGVAQWHISNAGTSDTNIGRNAIGIEFRCQHEIIICLK